jgi:PAS domain S-box-containing protein
MASPSSRLGRIVACPIGASLCLAIGYMVLCSAYIFLSGRIAAGLAMSVEQLRHFELLKGLAFVIITGAVYFGFSAFQLKLLRASELSYRRLFEAAKDGILILEADTGRITDVNPFLAELLGFSHKEMVGKTVGELSPFKDIVSNQAMLERLLQYGYVRYEDLPLQASDGRKIAVEFVCNEYQAGDRKVIQCNIRDITERKQAEDEVRRLSGHLLRSRDEERRRIGRELHDSTAQELVAVALNLGLVQERSAGRDVTADNLVADSQAIIEQCQRELRTLAYELHPPVLDDMGLVGAVQEYADGFTQRSGIRVTLDASPALGRLPSETEQALFRVVQENLGNVHRHSGSPTATIRIARENGDVVLEVSDRGRGLHIRDDGSVTNAGVGLAGMRERVRQLGGRFEIKSSGRGTTVRAIVPVEAMAA